MRRDRELMQLALVEARRAQALGDVPVGAVIAHRGQVIARGFNRREAWQDPTAHAELIAMRRAAEALGAWRLHECTLFVTLEPCPMCAGAIINARLPRVVFGALDDKAGAVRSRFALLEDPRLNHRVQVDTCLAHECERLLTDFFAQLRAKRASDQAPDANDTPDANGASDTPDAPDDADQADQAQPAPSDPCASRQDAAPGDEASER